MFFLVLSFFQHYRFCRSRIIVCNLFWQHHFVNFGALVLMPGLKPIFVWKSSKGGVLVQKWELLMLSIVCYKSSQQLSIEMLDLYGFKNHCLMFYLLYKALREI